MNKSCMNSLHNSMHKSDSKMSAVANVFGIVGFWFLFRFSILFGFYVVILNFQRRV